MVFGALLILLSVSHRFSFGVNLLELIGAFAHFGLGLSCLICLLAMLFRAYKLAGLTLVAIVHSTTLVAPSFLQSQLYTCKPEIMAVQANLWHHNSSPDKAVSEILKLNPEFISLQELNTEWSGLISETIKQSHPFFVESPYDSCCYGIGIYSKYPFLFTETVLLEGVPAIHAQLLVNGSDTVSVWSFHALAPAFPNETMERNNQLSFLAESIRMNSYPSLVLGDFNTVSWDPMLTDFGHSSDHKRLACGFQPTYPTDHDIPLIPIDHIFYNQKLLPVDCSSFKISGSDHRGLYASFSIKE